MIRYIDTFVRYLWLWILPLIVCPVVISMMLLSQSSYTATSSLWVEQPLFSEQTSQGFAWESPAKQMAGLLTELLNTRDFVNGVIDNTSRRATITSEAERARVIDYIVSKTKVDGDKFRLITLSFTDSKSNLAVETLDSIMARFRSYYDERIIRQGQNAVAYYQKVADAAKQDLDKAQKLVVEFIKDNPNQVGRDSGQKAVSPEELQYATLVQNRDAARLRYDEASKNLERVLLSYGAYREGQATTLRVQDKSVVQDSSSGRLRQILVGVAAGLAIGGIIAFVGTLFLSLLDESIRYGFHARQILSNERVMEVPNYRPVRTKNKKGAPVAQTEFEQGDDRKVIQKVFRLRSRLKVGSTLRQSLAEQIKVAQLGSSATE